MKFLDEIFSKMKFATIITDNGKEFANSAVKRWCEERGVRQKFSVPYYHQSNGGVERVNRTLRDAFRKCNGPVKVWISRIVDAYNNTIHRGIGMTPEGANKEQNIKLVKQKETKYKREFRPKRYYVPKLKLGDIVLIRNENTSGKMADQFGDEGKVAEVKLGNVYELLVKGQNNKSTRIRRYISQLRPVEEREVGSIHPNRMIKGVRDDWKLRKGC